MNATPKPGDPLVAVIRSLEEAEAALAAGQKQGRAVLLLSEEYAAAFAGASWFVALVALARKKFPQVSCQAMLDCGDRPGDVMAALQAGVTLLRYDGPEASRADLADMAAQKGAEIIRQRPDVTAP